MWQWPRPPPRCASNWRWNFRGEWCRTLMPGGAVIWRIGSSCRMDWYTWQANAINAQFGGRGKRITAATVKHGDTNSGRIAQDTCAVKETPCYYSQKGTGARQAVHGVADTAGVPSVRKPGDSTSCATVRRTKTGSTDTATLPDTSPGAGGSVLFN